MIIRNLKLLKLLYRHPKRGLFYSFGLVPTWFRYNIGFIFAIVPLPTVTIYLKRLQFGERNMEYGMYVKDVLKFGMFFIW